MNRFDMPSFVAGMFVMLIVFSIIMIDLTKQKKLNRNVWSTIMYVLFRRAAFEPFYLDSVHAHLVDAIKERDTDKWTESQIEYWEVKSEVVMRYVLDPTTYEFDKDQNPVGASFYQE